MKVNNEDSLFVPETPVHTEKEIGAMKMSPYSNIKSSSSWKIKQPTFFVPESQSSPLVTKNEINTPVNSNSNSNSKIYNSSNVTNTIDESVDLSFDVALKKCL